VISVEEITAGARTVTHLGAYFEEFKWRTLKLVVQIPAQERGYFTPDEETQLRAEQISYWKARSALLELIASFRENDDPDSRDRPAAFLVAFAAALILVDAARFLREKFGGLRLVRRKLNEPAPQFGIPGGTFDTVQRSLVSARHAWRLYHALKYFEENESELRRLGGEDEFKDVLAVVDRLRDRLDVSISRITRAHLHTRSGQMLRRVGRSVFGRALYGMQKLIAGTMTNIYTRPRHQPRIPDAVAGPLQETLAPGDVLIVRREYAVTNYFLPGYWPHAALYLGDAAELAQLGICDHENLQPSWAHELTTPGDQPRRVLESMKDGVRIRSLDSPLKADSIVVLRPQLSPREVADALARGLMHEGKPYDFDFDFTRSDRLICTEVVYRAYEGAGGMSLPLNRRAGRLTFSGRDLIALALAGEHFDPVAVFAPAFSRELLFGEQADGVLRRAKDL